MDQAPEVVEAFQVPEARAAGIPQADLPGQVGDLPVVIDIAVPAVARVLGVGEKEERVKTWGQRDDPHAGEHPPGQLCDRGRRSGRRFLFGDAPLLVPFVGGEEPWQQLQAVAASSATCSCARATSSTARSRTSMCLSQSNRRARSKARSPVAWFSVRESSKRVMPAA